MHPVVRYLLVATPLGVILFLALSGFFSSWEGRVVSYRPSRAEAPPVLPVLIVGVDAWGERAWPTELVLELGVEENPSALPPRKVPDDAPTTTKLPFTLSFVVSKPGESSRVVATTSPNALLMSLLAMLLGLFARNMAVSGHPLRFEPLPPGEQPEGSGTMDPPGPDGAPPPPAARPRGRQGPPPEHRTRGFGRR